MMLHRHFEEGNENEGMTRLADVTADNRRMNSGTAGYPEELRSGGADSNETPRRGRTRRTE